jgi:hypothetical protein
MSLDGAFFAKEISFSIFYVSFQAKNIVLCSSTNSHYLDNGYFLLHITTTKIHKSDWKDTLQRV